jgi:hypothetical protein
MAYPAPTQLRNDDDHDPFSRQLRDTISREIQSTRLGRQFRPNFVAEPVRQRRFCCACENFFVGDVEDVVIIDVCNAGAD